mmetsp:Transcript_33699/g.81583  ORF Transcript_33699/g.81583 Transcript_33699/m.81583 type:complete len:241 (-) Transcript_33699:826-1548(-)
MLYNRAKRMPRIGKATVWKITSASNVGSTTIYNMRMYQMRESGCSKMLCSRQLVTHSSSASKVRTFSDNFAHVSEHCVSQSRGENPASPYPRKHNAEEKALEKFCVADATDMKTLSLLGPALDRISSSTTQHWAPTFQKVNGLWKTRLAKFQRRKAPMATHTSSSSKSLPRNVIGNRKHATVLPASNTRASVTQSWRRKVFLRLRSNFDTTIPVGNSPSMLHMPTITIMPDLLAPCNRST